MKSKIRSIKHMVLSLRKVRSLKEKQLDFATNRRTLGRREEVLISSKDQKCLCTVANRRKDNRFLVMANLTSDHQLIANLILPWNREDKAFKRAIKKFDKLNCKNLGRSIRQRAIKHSLNLRLHSDGMKRYRNP
uniref:NTR domain-containing protein n=1 Tax=Syphacia muris TaxID=451379 RepID=A0A0N5AKY5_9BILA